jgi:hypothetical protein
MKRREKENRNKQEDEQGSYPMDTDFLYSFLDAPLTRGNFPLGELGLGVFTPSKSWKVANLKLFRFKKESEKIIQQIIIRLHVSRLAPLSITTLKVVVESITNDLLSITSTDMTFTQALK